MATVRSTQGDVQQGGRHVHRPCSGHDIRLWPRRCDDETMTISPGQANIFTEGTAVHTNQTPLIEEE
jgi:hypothetical protein